MASAPRHYPFWAWRLRFIATHKRLKRKFPRRLDWVAYKARSAPLTAQKTRSDREETSPPQ